MQKELKQWPKKAIINMKRRKKVVHRSAVNNRCNINIDYQFNQKLVHCQIGKIGGKAYVAESP